MTTRKAPQPSYQLKMIVRHDDSVDTLAELTAAISKAGAKVANIEGYLPSENGGHERALDVYCVDEAHQKRVIAAVEELDGIDLVECYDQTFEMHEGGKMETTSLCSVKDAADLSMAYTPGVARVCMAIHDDPQKSFDYTIRNNTVAIVSDGTAVLGLGDIGPEAAMPVMEGKALLFKEFADVDAFPLCLTTSDIDEIVETVERVAPTFGGVNLEDIAAPACFIIEERLKESLDIPIFHDDQHGTAIVALAALWNSLRIVDKKMEDISVVISGMGAAGLAIGKILIEAGVGNIIGVDSTGSIYEGRERLNFAKEWFAANTNPDKRAGTLQEVLVGADVFMGVSAPNLLTAADIRTMAKDPIVFAMANPTPEITPEAADGAAAVMATGRSDYPNQINNVLAFPGIFRGTFDANATDINEAMKLAAAKAIAGVVGDDVAADYVIPSAFDERVMQAVAPAVAQAAIDSGVVRKRR